MQIRVQHINVLLSGTSCNMPVYFSLPEPICLSFSKCWRQELNCMAPSQTFSFEITSSYILVFVSQNMTVSIVHLWQKRKKNKLLYYIVIKCFLIFTAKLVKRMGSRFALNRYASGQNALFTMFIIE